MAAANNRRDSDRRDRDPLGLTTREARIRRGQFGPNAIPEGPKISVYRRWLRQFQSPLIFILLLAMGVDSAAWVWEGSQGIPLESLAIGLILVLNAGLGVYQEYKSESALARLKSLVTPYALVFRDGGLRRLPAEDLVPGDRIRIEAGNRIPADGRLFQASGIQIDESVLTGESLPVDKSIGDPLLSGTQAVRGLGSMEVTATGSSSAMGRLAELIRKAQPEQTPLEKRLAGFSQRLAYAVLVLTGLIAVGGVWIEGWSQLGHVFLFAVALAVAAIPEGLPAVMTLTLALGVERMAARKAVVRRLSAVESLGSVTVIATDKTGTLTENRMLVREVITTQPERAARVLALANDADLETRAGDPLELALLDYVVAQGHDPNRWKQESPRVASLPFDSDRKYMQVTVAEPSGPQRLLKGAPETILALCRLPAAEFAEWSDRADDFARSGHRLLALAASHPEQHDGLDFLGLVLLWDPPRAEVAEAIDRCRAAGIRVILMTGDHPGTALAVASAVHLPADRAVLGAELDRLVPAEMTTLARETNVFARVSPENKLALVEALKADGQVVAVTGDGVNDAPALKRSDVGIAMGQRGSDLAREVADLVLLDDNFATLVAAVQEGRNIYENIQKFIRFLFATNLSEILIIAAGAVGAAWVGLKEASGTVLLPLTAVQLLWINVLTDGLPALASGLDRSSAAMSQRPRDPAAPLLDRQSIRFILFAAILMAVLAGGILLGLPHLEFSLEETRTAVFLFLTIGQLFFVYPARRVGVATAAQNQWLHLAVGAGVVLQVATVLIPPLRDLLGLTAVSGALWSIVIGLIAVSAVAGEIFSRWVSPVPPGIRPTGGEKSFGPGPPKVPSEERGRPRPD